MNFLAHAYLSFNDPQILAGNMISDFVKGAARLGFNGKVQQGIVLHRNIDAFTDAHPATAKAKTVFRPAYRLYSGAIIDIIYDHFLANDSNAFADSEALKAFADNTYQQLERQQEILPLSFSMAFTYMKRENWLYHYRTKEGIRKSIGGMVRRAAYLNDSSTAFSLLETHYSELEQCYQDFFPHVKQFAKQRFEELLSS